MNGMKLMESTREGTMHNGWYDEDKLAERVLELDWYSRVFDMELTRTGFFHECTCDRCQVVLICEFAYDLYNTDGDCLGMK